MTREKIKELIDAIKEYDIDYGWLEADWVKNGKILQRAICDVFYNQNAPLYIDYCTKNWDDFFFNVWYYDERMDCYITVLEDIENEFDFSSTADIIKLLRHYINTIEEYKTFYQIKVY